MTNQPLDALIMGAGVAGLYQLHMLREQGLNVRAYDAAGGVGGTWYWNRYPGARFDSESWTYGYSVDEDLLQEWDWRVTRLLRRVSRTPRVDGARPARVPECPGTPVPGRAGC